MDDGLRDAAARPVPEVGCLAHRQGRRPDRQDDSANYRAFDNFDEWEDLDGDGQIIIGAEQWPECLNPITECANSSWYVWTVAFPILPAVWDTTNDQTVRAHQRSWPASPSSRSSDP